jgi:hypothetical protein
VTLHTGLLEEWEFQMFLNLKLKLQNVRVRRQPELIELTGTLLQLLCNMEKLTTKNILSDTSEDFLNTGKISIQINNKPDSLIREKRPKILRND